MYVLCAFVILNKDYLLTYLLTYTKVLCMAHVDRITVLPAEKSTHLTALCRDYPGKPVPER